MQRRTFLSLLALAGVVPGSAQPQSTVVVEVGKILLGAALPAALDALKKWLEGKPKGAITKAQAIQLYESLQRVTAARERYVDNVKPYLAALRNRPSDDLSELKTSAVAAADELMRALRGFQGNVEKLGTTLPVFAPEAVGAEKQYAQSKSDASARVRALDRMRIAERKRFEQDLDENGPRLNQAINSLGSFIRENFSAVK